jgi:hypothetical protein
MVDPGADAQCSVWRGRYRRDWQTGSTCRERRDDNIDTGTPLRCSDLRHKQTELQQQAVADLNVTVQDDDTAGFTVSPTAMTVSEPSGSKRFYIYLTSQPTANVVVGASTSSTQCSVSPASVTLTAANWDTGVNVRVAASRRSRDGNQPCPVVRGRSVAATSTPC